MVVERSGGASGAECGTGGELESMRRDILALQRSVSNIVGDCAMGNSAVGETVVAIAIEGFAFN